MNNVDPTYTIHPCCVQFSGIGIGVLNYLRFLSKLTIKVENKKSKIAKNSTEIGLVCMI